MTKMPKEFSQSYFHGTKAKFKIGDLIVAGKESNYEESRKSKYVYFTSNLSVAVWGAELAAGQGAGNIYIVEPLDVIENDPNVTDKRFPGNPTNSFRSKSPLQVVGVLCDWQGHSREEIEARKESIKQIMQNGGQIIED